MHHSNATTNPPGQAVDRREVTSPALHETLMEAVLASDNVKQAWRRVKSHRGAPGIDGLPLDDFPAYAREHWPAIRHSLHDGRYQPHPVRWAIQQAIAQVMTPIFDPEFSDSSDGFRPGHSAPDALRPVRTDLKAGYRIAVDLDLAKFFDHVDPDLLMACVARKVRDKRWLALIGTYLPAGVLIDDELQPSELGTPQGGPLSPLLAHILLDDLDKELTGRRHRFARYADDLRVLVRSERAGQRVNARLTHTLTGGSSGRSLNSMNGCVGGYACATGNRGATPGRRSALSWRWGLASARRS